MLDYENLTSTPNLIIGAIIIIVLVLIYYFYFMQDDASETSEEMRRTKYPLKPWETLTDPKEDFNAKLYTPEYMKSPALYTDVLGMPETMENKHLYSTVFGPYEPIQGGNHSNVKNLYSDEVPFSLIEGMYSGYNYNTDTKGWEQMHNKDLYTGIHGPSSEPMNTGLYRGINTSGPKEGMGAGGFVDQGRQDIYGGQTDYQLAKLNQMPRYGFLDAFKHL